jgi:hypothetical protein
MPIRLGKKIDVILCLYVCFGSLENLSSTRILVSAFLFQHITTDSFQKVSDNECDASSSESHRIVLYHENSGQEVAKEDTANRVSKLIFWRFF